jgi:hypothetical protein
MKKAYLLLFAAMVIAMPSCEEEDTFCDDNYFKLYQLGDGSYLETDVSTDRVSMLFQVLDKNDKGVVGLDVISRYSLLDYEQEMVTNVEADVQIESFGTIPTQIYTAILLDISRSVEGFVPQIKQAASEFVNLSLDEQLIAIYTFDGDAPIRRINFTANKTQLLSAINSIPESNLGSSTNLYEALAFAEFELPESVYTTSQITQGNLIVFTDGRETANPTSNALQSVLAQLSDRTVFVAALNSPDLDTESLTQIAKTEGNYFLASNIDELKTKFSSIQNDIEKLSKSVYWLFYTSPRKGTNTWQIELKIKDNCNTESDVVLTGAYFSQGF